VTDMDAMTAACQGADAVIHLARHPGEASWERISELNINGSYVAFEAARRAGTPRVIFASSKPRGGVHPARGLPGARLRLPQAGTPTTASRRRRWRRWPRCTTNGTGMDAYLPADLVLLPAAAERPDAVHLAVARRRGPALRGLPDRRTARGSASPSACPPTPAAAGSRWDEARALGYQPEDDAEAFARPRSSPSTASRTPDNPVLRRLGGEFTLPDDQIPRR